VTSLEVRNGLMTPAMMQYKNYQLITLITLITVITLITSMMGDSKKHASSPRENVFGAGRYSNQIINL
jgi:hypothetical protein